MKAENLIKLQKANLPVPAFIVVNANTQNLAQKVADFQTGKNIAIRSSFSLEDGAEKSFAGAFSSFLNVKPSERISAVKAVFDSASNMQTGEMSVILQEMIESDFSGVIFTSNPHGLLNEIVINKGCGLGEGVVNKETPTTSYYKNKHNNKGYYETSANSPLLKKEQLEALFKMAQKIEKLYAKPMDIEFAIKGDDIFCLQARPITALNMQKLTVLDNSNIIENYPDVVCPLTADFVKTVYASAYENALGEILTKKQMVEFAPLFKQMVAENNSRMYYQAGNWYALLECLPFSKKLLTIWEEMIGINNVEREHTHRSFFDKLTLGIKFIFILAKTQKQMDALDVHFKSVIEQYRAKINVGTLQDVLALYKEIKVDFEQKWGITLFNDLYAFIFMALAKKYEKKLVSGIDSIESMRPIKLLREINLAQTLNDAQSVEKLKKNYIHLYGDRYIEELKLESKTPRTNPELLDEILQNTDFTVHKSAKLLNESANSKTDIKPSFFEKKAKLGIEGREVSRLNRGRLFGLVREIFLRIGSELAQDEIICEARDVFYLRYAEIEQIIQGQNTTDENIKQRIEKRKARLTMHKALPTYDRLIFAGEIFDKTPQNINNVQTPQGKNTLQGVPVSSGVVTAQTIVVEKLSAEIDTKGKILVTTSTDPGWVFFIEQSAGVIAERGSLLSHTSIITRELKKPAVVALSDITRLVKTGDILELNGTTGEVKIIENKI